MPSAKDTRDAKDARVTRDAEPDPGISVANAEQVREYYRETWRDYRRLWSDPNAQAIHFGYWDATTATHADSLLRMNAVMAQAVGVQPGEEILDAGCGVGGSAVWLAATYGARVTGITLVDEQAEIATTTARERGVADACAFSVGDYTHTRFAPASFDILWAQESVSHAPDRSSFVREAWRLLRPGGRLVQEDIFASTVQPTRREQELVDEMRRAWLVEEMPTAAAYEGCLQETGFVDIQIRDISQQVRPSIRRLRNYARLLYPIAARRARRGDIAQIRADNIKAGFAHWETHRKGLWLMAILTARKPISP